MQSAGLGKPEPALELVVDRVGERVEPPPGLAPRVLGGALATAALATESLAGAAVDASSSDEALAPAEPEPLDALVQPATSVSAHADPSASRSTMPCIAPC
jgi:hypothetical protein